MNGRSQYAQVPAHKARQLLHGCVTNGIRLFDAWGRRAGQAFFETIVTSGVEYVGSRKAGVRWGDKGHG